MGKSLLIIGGTGFFGKSILDSFKRGLLIEFNISNVIVLSRNTHQFIKDFPELCFKGVELLNGDISNVESIPFADFVIHAASSTNMSDYTYSSNNNGKNNIEESIINYCKIAPIFHLKSKILYCSSGAVYGKQPLNIEKIDEGFQFQNDLSDLTIEKKNYCLGKRFAEKQVLNLGITGLNVSVARCFAFYGKYLPSNNQFAYSSFLNSAKKNEKIIVNSSGVVFRSYMNADALVISLLKILMLADTSCPIFNVGSDVSVSLYDLAKKIAIQHKVEFEFPNYSDIILDRYVPNTDKLKSVFSKI